MPETVSQLVWFLFLGSCSLLLLSINLFLASILKRMAWVDKYMRKWRGEESAAINEIQGRCCALHPDSPPIRHFLSND